MTKLRASRFETKSLGLALDPDDATPGPGSYIKLNSFARDASTNKGFRDGPKGQQGGGQKDRERMSSLRACSAPSIPVHRQCFGFEEDDAGRLIRQPAPAEWMDGRGKDTAGPGHYDPRLDACAKRYDTACQSVLPETALRSPVLPAHDARWIFAAFPGFSRLEGGDDFDVRRSGKMHT
uniref:Uncharacterized protein n=1 Tax=Chromera velia CCMP2878 TaxID=1169474 RepID=A0A0K6S7Y8_9ALVE|eukprot:Cvel_22937.t2-p1 / transcript=Cvel_22937.t2 / gene=Cvel_22937 / organism=Chromera_velia_CCMP2878 / gene_product=hypothetical protein / transcript_product=hypothetical protein / location=Cvel_scaffold2308:6470-8684(+) / protein_length=178 / sequence_SO=supercontig / SO=protein_coding / is_pseudo=false